MTVPPTLNRILDQARWAPSGDNTQPWRFEILAADRLRIHASDTRDWCVYDLEGRASQLAVGTLLENLAIAASAEGMEAHFDLAVDAPETRPVIDMTLAASRALTPDPLHPHLQQRVTQRRPLSRAPLRAPDRADLATAAGPGYSVLWIEGAGPKWQMARLLFRNAHIRLTIKEAYEVHKRIIQWDAETSEDRLPDRSIGLDPLGLKAMRWAMRSWQRVDFLNRYLGGTLLPRLQMDLLPALGCAAHFLLVADKTPEDLAGYLAAGRAVQRFWLTATARGLQFQPEVTPIIFSGYVRAGTQFTTSLPARQEAERLRRDFALLVGEPNLDRAVFAGRVGYGPAPSARSVRLPLARLLVET